MQAHKSLKRIALTALILMIAIQVMAPLSAHMQGPEQKVVRVGWYESPFNYSDQYGRRSGYAYEYQKRFRRTPAGSTNTWKAAGPSFCKCSSTAKST